MLTPEPLPDIKTLSCQQQTGQGTLRAGRLLTNFIYWSFLAKNAVEVSGMQEPLREHDTQMGITSSFFVREL